MYGKRRIVIRKNNEIVLAGRWGPGTGGNWLPVGFILPHTMADGRLHAKTLKEVFDRDSPLVDVFAANKKELRGAVNERFRWLEEEEATPRS